MLEEALLAAPGGQRGARHAVGAAQRLQALRGAPLRDCQIAGQLKRPRVGGAANAGARELILEHPQANVELQGYSFKRAATSVCCLPAGLLCEPC
jgi:hypothetical protein